MGKIMHENKVYSGGGGSVVEANPSDTAGENLTKIKIDGSTYAIPQGGGGGSVDDVQVDNVSVVDQNGVAHIDTMAGASSSSAGTKGLVPAPASGDNEKFLAGDGTWKAVPGGGASAISQLTDVDLDNLSDGQILKWNAATEKWENADESGGGGGSGYSETTLFTGTYQTTIGEITLDDDLDNYDQIVIYARWSVTSTNGATPFLIERAYFVSHYPYDNGSTAQTSNHIVLCPYYNQYIRVKCGTANNKLFLFDAHSIAIERVTGLKYGGSSGGSKYEIKTLTWIGDGATTKSWTFDKKPIMILSMDGMGSDNYVNIPPFRYGSPQAQGFYGGGSAATGTNGGVLHCPVSYSNDMLTMTMRGVDAGAICNLSGKTNTMYYLVES